MGEVILFVVQAVCEIFAEFLIQIIAELFGGASVKLLKPRNSGKTIITFTIYVAAGIICGCLSVWLLPDNFIRRPFLRIFALVINPIFAGLALSWMNRQNDREQRFGFQINSFINGCACVFSMALVRFFFTN